jgi:DNA-binding Lrp family transcriptional regulator
MTYTDTWDVSWTLVSSDLNEFDTLLTHVLTTFTEVVVEWEKMAVVRKYEASSLPRSLRIGAQPPRRPPRKCEGPVELEGKEYALLAALASDCRQSTYELGRKLGSSPDAIAYRLKGLGAKCVISSFTSVFNLSRLGLAWYTYAIRFHAFTERDEAKLAEFVRQNPHIVRAVKVFGSWDVLLDIVADSPADYHATVKEIKNAFADIIYSYQTWLAHEELFVTGVPAVIVKSD